MVFKKITYSLPALKTLLESKNSCVYCIKNCQRSLTILPADLSDLKNSVNVYLSAKVTTCDPELKGIILSHKNIKIIDSVQLNDDGNYRLDFIADTYIFKPEVGSLLAGTVNKKSSDHLGVLVHSVFNATIPRPRPNENGCPRTWAGSNVKIGQQVTFEVVKVNFSTRLPYIKGKLIGVDQEKYNEDGDSGIGGHESTEEGNTYKGSFEKSIDFGENTKKKKKKQSAFGEGLPWEPLGKKESPSTSFSLTGGTNSSNLSEIESLLLNEAIATVSSSGSHLSGNEKSYERSPPLLSPRESLSEQCLGEPTKKRKRKSSATLINENVSSILNFSNSDEHPKVKKKKLSKDKSNEPAELLQDNANSEREEVIKKKKKSKDNSNPVSDNLTGDKTTVTDVQSTIENLLSFATDSIKHKKKKKKKSSTLIDNGGETFLESNESESITPSEHEKGTEKYNNFVESVNLETKEPIDDTTLRLCNSPGSAMSLYEEERPKEKKKKKSHSHSRHCEEISILNSETESHDSPSDIHREHTKKDKKRKSLSHDKEFLQMENDCIAELLSSFQPKISNEEINTSLIEKKKKKKKTKESSSIIQDSNEFGITEMPPPSSTKIKKKRSSIIPFSIE